MGIELREFGESFQGVYWIYSLFLLFYFFSMNFRWLYLVTSLVDCPVHNTYRTYSTLFSNGKKSAGK